MTIAPVGAKTGNAQTSQLFMRDGVLPAAALFLVSLVWVPAMVMAILLLLRVNSWGIPAAVLSAVVLAVIGWLSFRTLSRAEVIRLSAALLIVVLVSAAASIVSLDSSTDGRNYHADAILGLLHGINPIVSQIPGVQPIWANHYPKATWYFAALVVKVFHNYQLGKIYNFLLIFASMAYAGDFLRKQGLSGRSSTLLAAVTAFSPVALAQMFTFYIDGALGALLTLIILSAVNIVFRRSLFDSVLFALSASLAMSIKFTGVPYVGAVLCVLFATYVVLWLQHRTADLVPSARAVAVSFAAAAFLGVLVIGYDPYITNVQQGLHPMYPVLGPNKIDIMTPTQPEAFNGHSYGRGQKFVISFFGKTQAHYDQPTALKIPFMVSKAEFVSLGAPDSRIGGWGMLFSGIALLTLLIFFLAKGWQNPQIVLAIVLVLFTSFINPECWWARYTPQIAMLPVLFLVPALAGGRGRVRAFARLLCLVLFLNNLISAGAAAGAAFVKTRMLDRSFNHIAQTSGTGEYWAYSEPDNLAHYDQYSGLKGVVICGQTPLPEKSLPEGGIPLSTNMDNETQVVLYKGNCSSGPPL